MAPDDWWTAGTLARALVDAGRPEEALEQSERLVSSRPDYGFAVNTHVIALNMLERCSEALTITERLRELDDTTGIEMQSVTLHLLGRHDEALAVIASASSPTPYLRYVEGATLTRVGRDDEAAAALRRARAGGVGRRPLHALRVERRATAHIAALR